MKKRIMRRLMDEMFPSRTERFMGPFKRAVNDMTFIVDSEVIKTDYQGFPYSISRKIFRHSTPNRIVYESHLEGITLPVYRNSTINYMVRRITTDLVRSACGLGLSNPESSMIVVSIDDIPTDEPEQFDVFYDVQKKQQSPRIRGKEEEGVTELIAKTEKVYDFFTKHGEGFKEALKIIDKEYLYRSEECGILMDRIADECRLDFIRLQSRPRTHLNTPQRMREIMQRAYGSQFSTQ